MANFSKNRPVFKSKTEIYKKSNWQKLRETLALWASNFRRALAKLAFRINEKGSQRLTIMVVPHSEKKIVNLQISNYILFFATVIVSVTIATSIIAISNNQQTTKQFERLKTQDGYKRIMIEEYRKSIESVNKRFTMFKTDINNIIRSAGKDKNIYNFNEIEILDEYSNRSVPKEVSDLEKLKLELDVTKENIRRMGVFIAEQKNLLKSMPSIYPMATRARITSTFGLRIDPVYKWKQEMHQGIDMVALPGVPVFSTADGEISIAGFNGGYGLMVEVRHKYGFATRYAHLMRFAPGVYVGSSVKQGQTIGYVGTTGKSTGYHLHYEVRVGDRVIDPEPFVSMLP